MNQSISLYIVPLIIYLINRMSFKMDTDKQTSSDCELIRLSDQLDKWCTDLKRNVLVSVLSCLLYFIFL